MDVAEKNRRYAREALFSTNLGTLIRFKNFKMLRELLSSESELVQDPEIYSSARFKFLRVREVPDPEKKEFVDCFTNFLNISTPETTYEKLKHAVISGDLNLTESLLQENINIDASDESLAIYALGRWNMETRKDTLKLLLEHPNLNLAGVRDEWGGNLLVRFLRFFAKKGDEDLVDISRIFIKHGVEAGEADILGCTPLRLALEIRDDALVDFFLDESVDVNARDNLGSTALHWAARYCDADVTRRILCCKQDVEVDAENKDGLTAIQMARRRKKEDVVECLIEFGAKDIEGPYEDESERIQLTEDDLIIQNILSKPGKGLLLTESDFNIIDAIHQSHLVPLTAPVH